METWRTAAGRTALGRALAFAALAVLIIVVFSDVASANGRIRVDLLPLAGAPNASGEASLKFEGGIATGTVKARGLPAQAFGSARFYGIWLVRTDLDSRAFVGALVSRRSIILDRGGKGEAEFRATHYTDGPRAGQPIMLGPRGTNVLVVLIENNINGLNPSPVAPAIGGTF